MGGWPCGLVVYLCEEGRFDYEMLLCFLETPYPELNFVILMKTLFAGSCQSLAVLVFPLYFMSS